MLPVLPVRACTRCMASQPSRASNRSFGCCSLPSPGNSYGPTSTYLFGLGIREWDEDLPWWSNGIPVFKIHLLIFPGSFSPWVITWFGAVTHQSRSSRAGAIKSIRKRRIWTYFAKALSYFSMPLVVLVCPFFLVVRTLQEDPDSSIHTSNLDTKMIEHAKASKWITYIQKYSNIIKIL